MRKGGIRFLVVAMVVLMVAVFVQAQVLEKNVDVQKKLEQMRQDIEANGWTFEVGFNEAMQYDLEDITGYRAELGPDSYHQDGLILDENNDPECAPVAEGKPGGGGTTLPAAYVGYASSVKNQGSCGSCWAFSTIGNLEAMALKMDGAPKATAGTNGVSVSGNADLSEQQLLSCNPYGYSCNGGNFAYDMLMPSKGYNGAVTEGCFRYAGKVSNCALCSGPVYQPVLSWSGGGTSIPSIDSIKNAIYTYGSVSAAVYADSYFQAYRSGVYTSSLKPSGCNHAIILCGWDDAKQAWLLKNSWGTSWGMGGFMWIKYGTCRVGQGTGTVTTN